MSWQSNEMKGNNGWWMGGVPLILTCTELSHASDLCMCSNSRRQHPGALRFKGWKLSTGILFSNQEIWDSDSWLRCGFLIQMWKSWVLASRERQYRPQAEAYALLPLKHCLNSFWRYCSWYMVQLNFGHHIVWNWSTEFRRGWGATVDRLPQCEKCAFKNWVESSLKTLMYSFQKVLFENTRFLIFFLTCSIWDEICFYANSSPKAWYVCVR